ncbi:thioredoxin [Actinospongicola halichondriae]|uniref:thioredoxin n=1 Tax=Actinospongicola halichondriae TaxID=3236844 RepID=UPI003D4A1DD1
MAYIDVTDATFQTDVIDRSAQVTVVVDLWAEWCGPCKTLGPIIEKVIDDTQGKVVLAKVDVDANPQISQAFQVQSIPAVYALKDGKVVEGFVGAQPEATVKAWVDALQPTEEESEVQQLIAAGDDASLRKALELEPDNAAAITALAALLATSEDGQARLEALALLAKIPETDETRLIAAQARAANPDVPADVDAKLEDLLQRVKADEDARQEFLDLLELMGPTDPRTADYRKRLTAQLF